MWQIDFVQLIGLFNFSPVGNCQVNRFCLFFILLKDSMGFLPSISCACLRKFFLKRCVPLHHVSHKVPQELRVPNIFLRLSEMQQGTSHFNSLNKKKSFTHHTNMFSLKGQSKTEGNTVIMVCMPFSKLYKIKVCVGTYLCIPHIAMI